MLNYQNIITSLICFIYWPLAEYMHTPTKKMISGARECQCGHGDEGREGNSFVPDRPMGALLLLENLERQRSDMTYLKTGLVIL